jgi:DNA-binding transcriptional LysR family regulator
MFRSLPLNALRAFEASARHLSFKLAADELAVTPAAVSHQIRTLEDWLGVALFERFPRGVRLTTRGETLFYIVHSALLDMAQVASSFRPTPEPSKLTISIAPSFAALWLIPRIDRFYEAFPQIQLRLDTTAALIDLHQDASVDIAIRYGSDTYPGLYVSGLIKETFGVYGSAERVAKVADQAPVLITVEWGRSETYKNGWGRWCAAAGLTWQTAQGTIRAYAEEMYAFQAAIAGQGLVLASSILVSEYVKNGLLAPYLPAVTVSGGEYAALCVPGRERHPPVRAFLAWLDKEWASPQGPRD